jgi:hypothetical protein
MGNDIELRIAGQPDVDPCAEIAPSVRRHELH